jgi:hypothetical protein
MAWEECDREDEELMFEAFTDEGAFTTNDEG